MSGFGVLIVGAVQMALAYNGVFSYEAAFFGWVIGSLCLIKVSI